MLRERGGLSCGLVVDGAVWMDAKEVDVSDETLHVGITVVRIARD